MKARISILLLLFVSVTTFSSYTYIKGDAAQPKNEQLTQKADNVFRSFFLHRQHNGVAINWNVSSNDINSYIIQKSYDGEYFDNIDLPITSVGRWSRSIDNNVFPGYIHYRIIAIMNDGTECSSPVEFVRIVSRK